MNPVFQCPQFHIYDDVLSSDDFRAVWTFVQLETFVPVHKDVWQKAWRITDGIPLRSLTAVMQSDPHSARTEASAREGGRPPLKYPTHTGVDKVLDVILAGLDPIEELVGRRNVDFDGVSACAYLYPQGTGLSWHEDVPRLYTGGYIFYAHPEWNCQWGGELLVADESSRARDLGAGKVVGLRREGAQLKLATVGIPSFLDNEQENRELERMAMGRYIAPKPNRLVVLASGNPHMINRVSSAAGDHVRCSISGFFHRPGA